jgi:dihydroorotate dehydrogenase
VNPPGGPAIEPLVISATFGNYVQPQGTTPTLGTYTALRRGGRPAAAGRALLTVRYYRRLGAWVNRIGLRNPGIDSLTTGQPHGRPIGSCILSIHGFSDGEWRLLLERVATLRPLAVELNISCPNVGELTWPPGLFRDAVATGVPVIVKLPPIRYGRLARDSYEQQVRWFHATNTLPVPNGGMSGAPLKPIALEVVRRLRERYGDEIGIIGGGGIRSPQDVDDYAKAGADRFAVGTYAMRPTALRSDRWVAEILAAARQHALPAS